MTLTPNMEVDDENDVEIVLEEVSKIFRCKECFRCFLSLSKYSEHFPKYHPEKTKQLFSSLERKSPTSIQQVSQNEDESDKVQILNKTIVPGKKTISLKKLRQTSKEMADSSEDSERSETSGSTMSDSSKDCTVKATSEPTRNMISLNRRRSDPPPSSTLSSHASSEQLDPPNESKSHENAVSEKPTASTSLRITHGSQPPQQGVSNSGNSRAYEVITLSDSEDDDDHNKVNAMTSQTHDKQPVVKQEVDCSQEDDNSKSANDDFNKQNVKQPEVTEDPYTFQEPEKESNLNLAASKNYACQYCSKSFTRDRTLQSHIKGTHRDQVEAEKKEQTQQDGGQKGEGEEEAKRPKEKPASTFPQNTNSSEVKPKTGNRKRGLATTETRKKTSKKAKRQKNHETNPAPKKKEKDSEDGQNEIPSLTFSCKWCPEKFLTLEQLKHHAINTHIKYKTQ